MTALLDPRQEPELEFVLLCTSCFVADLVPLEAGVAWTCGGWTGCGELLVPVGIRIRGTETYLNPPLLVLLELSVLHGDPSNLSGPPPRGLLSSEPEPPP